MTAYKTHNPLISFIKNKDMNTKIKKQLFLAMTALVFTACSENILDEQTFSSSKGRSANVQLNVSTASEQGEAPDTRAIQPKSVNEGTDANYTVSDFWLLEYGADGNLMKVDGSPMVQYITMTELKSNENKLNIQLPSEGSSDIYKCVMIANTHDKDFFKKDDTTPYNTLEKLKGFTKDITSFEDTYNSTGGTKDLYLSCVAEVNSTSTSLNCKFYRNVAKLTLQLKNAENSGMQLTSVQICNVPNKMAYADRLYDGNTAQMASGATTTDMPEDPIQMAEGTNLSFIYYLPRNCQGKDESITDVKYKNTSNAATSATCVKVYATEIKTDNPYCYTFYLGENMTTDFNVLSNYHYTLPITISAPGDAKTDPRVENLGSVELEANCIMMNSTKIYSIIPAHRINLFWDSEDGNKNNVIGSDTEWTAEVIWSDIEDKNAIVFCDKSGSKSSSTYSGKGISALYFKRGSNTQRNANILIGIKKKDATQDDGYLWSWHLWLTNYNPNIAAAKKPWEQDVYKIGVTNGSVYRYTDEPSLYSSYHTWSEKDGKYKDKYIMDRNLGAIATTEPTPDDEFETYCGLLYQFGRKDPFVNTGIALYKDGTLLDSYTDDGGNQDYVVLVNNGKASKFMDGVKNPILFYTKNTGIDGDWVTSSTNRNDWKNPDWYTSESGKSFFDPCPKGWKVPQKYTWNNFPRNRTNYGNGYGFNISQNITTFYPSIRSRFPSSGRYEYSTVETGYWSSTIVIGAGGRGGISSTLFFSPLNEETFDPLFPKERAFGLAVRCVQE